MLRNNTDKRDTGNGLHELTKVLFLLAFFPTLYTVPGQNTTALAVVE
jgi:hypothetical protein